MSCSNKTHGSINSNLDIGIFFVFGLKLTSDNDILFISKRLIKWRKKKKEESVPLQYLFTVGDNYAQLFLTITIKVNSLIEWSSWCSHLITMYQWLPPNEYQIDTIY